MKAKRRYETKGLFYARLLHWRLAIKIIWDLHSSAVCTLRTSYPIPCRLYLCCWRCRSRSPALRSMWWLCWRPAQRRGSVEGSAPRARVFVLEEQIKPICLAVNPTLITTRVCPREAYHHRAEDTDSLRGLWPATRPPLRRSHRTLLHCSYPAVPRSPLSWPPATRRALFIHAHTRLAVQAAKRKWHITICQPSLAF